LVTHQTDYDAFGEVTQAATNGQVTQYSVYDNAGRVWKTNSGDGVDKVMLYDAQGHVTAQITSSVVGAVAALQSQQDADLLGVAGERRADTQVDLLGRIVQQTQGARSAAGLNGSSGSNGSNELALSSTVLASAQPLLDEDGATTGWAGSNQVRLDWTS